MENILKLLISVAEDLDNQGLASIADRVDRVANKVLDIKTAQYVGIQGYWIRNSRCWSNCYRKKRTENPTKAAQQVWTECHNEYVESMNDDDSKWNKYAEDESMIKTASSELKAEFYENKKNLEKSIQEKLIAGVDLGSAIFASIEEKTQAPYDSLIIASNELLDIASNLVSSPDLSLRLSEVADQMVKEAGMFGGLSRAIGDKVHGLKMDYNVGSYIQNMDKAVNSISQALGNFESQKSKLVQYLGNFKPRNNQQAQSLQQVLSGMNSFKVAQPNSITDKWSNIKQIVNGLASSINSTPGQPATGAAPTPAQAPAQPTTPGAPPPLPTAATSPTPPTAGVGGATPPANPAPANPTPATPNAATPPKPAAPITPNPATPAAAPVPRGIVHQQLQQIPPELLDDIIKAVAAQKTASSYFKLSAIGDGGSSMPLPVNRRPGDVGVRLKKEHSKKEQLKRILNKLDPETVSFLKGLQGNQVSELIEYYTKLKGK